jgi:pimeloyl-ACP methyl ester carboxylesterase
MGNIRALCLAVVDTLGGWLGRRPMLVELAGPRGTVTLVTTPDGQLGDAALNAGNRYPHWAQRVAARSLIGLAGYRPGKRAKRISKPVLFVVCDDDLTTLAAATTSVAGVVPGAEIAHFPGGHYAPFMAAHEDVVQVELEFLSRHLAQQAQTASGGSTR